MYVVIFFVGALFIGCNDKPQNFGSNVSPSQMVSTVTPTPQSALRPVMEPLKDKYTNDDGWKIPLPKNKIDLKTNSSDAKTISGKPIQVVTYDYAPEEDLLISEPFESIGQKRFGLLKVHRILDFKVRDRIYSYSIVVNKAIPHKDNGKMIGTGPGFTFTYTDLDGDGKFETLTFGQKEGIPDWVLQ